MNVKLFYKDKHKGNLINVKRVKMIEKNMMDDYICLIVEHDNGEVDCYAVDRFEVEKKI